MKFRLEMMLPKFPFAISHKDPLFLIGSCFTENMGDKLRQALFATTENPHGILFNPFSVHKAISDYIHNIQYTKADLFYYNEAWHSWHHHSRFSAATAEESIERINASISNAHERLLQSKYLIITLGSAWVYALTNEAMITPNTTIVANNHKAPAQWFYKRLMELGEIVGLYQTLFQKLQAINPSLQIILTVSPVRHLREGTVMNNLSKAHLLAAAHKLSNLFEFVHYFPSYELVIDDLRDYRFYAEDLVHPNYFATEYVWEKWQAACFNEETAHLISNIKELTRAYQHKPFNPNSDAHAAFRNKYYQKTASLLAEHPYLPLKDFLGFFR